MKTFLNKLTGFLYNYWYLITFAFTVLLDTQNEILSKLIGNEKIILLIRFVGMIVLAYKFNTRKRNENA
jgi:small neutral amino acid transporter SnatA (MarC family)